jgi:hypothetical protein
MDTSHYVEAIINGEDVADVMARMMAAVHGHNRDDARPGLLGVAFPHMQAAVFSEQDRMLAPCRSGSTLRIFGSPEMLADFVASHIPRKLSRLGALRFSAVLATPDNHLLVRYVRDRRLEKLSPDSGANRRRRAHAAAGKMAAANPCRPRVDVHSTFKLEQRSLGNEQSFPLVVRREPWAGARDVASVSFNNYGLCSGASACVPHW